MNTFNKTLNEHGYDAEFWRNAFTQYWYENTGSDTAWLDTETGAEFGYLFCYEMSDCCGRTSSIATLFENALRYTFKDE